jgi:hypothetical protein
MSARVVKGREEYPRDVLDVGPGVRLVDASEHAHGAPAQGRGKDAADVAFAAPDVVGAADLESANPAGPVRGECVRPDPRS